MIPLVDVKADGVRTQDLEECCMCGEPTSTWFAEKDVPVCRSCGRSSRADDVPTKRQWLNDTRSDDEPVLPRSWKPLVTTEEGRRRYLRNMREQGNKHHG